CAIKYPNWAFGKGIFGKANRQAPCYSLATRKRGRINRTGRMMKNTPTLSLRVPEPSGRPGDAPDFSHLKLDAPGAVERPDVSTAPYDMRDMAFRLVRVLDDAGQAVGPWNPKLDPETLRRGL